MANDPNDVPYWRGETCRIIRQQFWLGTRPPEQGWSMNRECTIFNGFLRQFSAQEIFGAYSVMRRCLGSEIPNTPVDGRVFNVAGKRDRLARCVAFWRREQSQAPAPPTVKDLIDSVRLGRFGHVK
jgi:hypothetical protein